MEMYLVANKKVFLALEQLIQNFIRSQCNQVFLIKNNRPCTIINRQNEENSLMHSCRPKRHKTQLVMSFILQEENIILIKIRTDRIYHLLDS